MNRGSAPRTFGVPSQRGFVVDPPPHPLAIEDLDGLVELADDRRSRGPLVADLFCGCGGLSLGAEAAGFVPVLGVDHDPMALQTWRSLFPGLAIDLDLGDPHVVEDLGDLLARIKVDMIVGGPPCQPFSRAGRSLLRHLVATGRRDGMDARRELWRSFLDITRAALPRIVLMENVPELALGDDTLLVRTIVDELEQLGYGVETRIVSTTDHGVPQYRQRAIIVGLRGEIEYQWPAPVEWASTLRQAIGDLPEVEPGWTRLGADEADQYHQPVPAGELVRWLRAGVPEADACLIRDHVTRSVRDDDLEIFRAMDSSTKYSDIDASLKRYRDDIFDDKYKRLDWDRPSRSITAHLAKDGYWYIHPEQHRTLTIREAARVQTFPDRVRFAGPPSASLRQIGNAVPPLAARHLVDAAVSSLEDACPATPTRTVAAALKNHYIGQDRLNTPWLDDSNSPWQVIQCELLVGRADTRTARAVHMGISRFVTPQDTLAEEAELRQLLADTLPRARLDRVVAAAEWFASEPGEHFESAESMSHNPHVPRHVARIAALVGCPADSPVLATSHVLRVAARFTGRRIDKVNRNSDGRLAVARMVGGSVFEDPEDARHAHLGLIELASTVCTPSAPRCEACPLRGWCSYARSERTANRSGEQLDVVAS